MSSRELPVHEHWPRRPAGPATTVYLEGPELATSRKRCGSIIPSGDRLCSTAMPPHSARRRPSAGGTARSSDAHRPLGEYTGETEQEGGGWPTHRCAGGR